MSLLFGGTGLGALVTWKFARRKEKAEAQSAEVNVAQEVQETYQKMLADKNLEVDDKNRIITELREDRDRYKKSYDELRERQDKTDEIVRSLQEKVAKNGQELDMMRPFMCGVIGCKLRRGTVNLNEDETSPLPASPRRGGRKK